MHVVVEHTGSLNRARVRQRCSSGSLYSSAWAPSSQPSSTWRLYQVSVFFHIFLLSFISRKIDKSHVLLKIDYMKVESNVRRIYYAWNELGEWLLLLRIHGENGFTRITAADSFHDFTLHLVQVGFPILVWDLRIRSVRGIYNRTFLAIHFPSDNFLINCGVRLCCSLELYQCERYLFGKLKIMQSVLIERFIEF